MLVDGAHITSQIFDPGRSATGLVTAVDRLLDTFLPADEKPSAPTGPDTPLTHDQKESDVH
ncbi:hypothetical protein [Streptosporangium pseudovulgare]|uniref:Uncharacterized protein n=1 Tax=Streptosporangium pseudovulgare TaxID=35765 RepID=A0ABQ2RB98_9ACTN|nr:hypothetical protein [Streptosporangium pseudovulgare]GGQ22374.1 hypothetical protein GCM10010140_60860 [Streptosporangium pseudovulgare]